MPTVCSKNRERLMDQEVGRLFFDAVVRQAREAELMSDDHFTVDGTVIEALGKPQELWTQERRSIGR